MGDIMMHVGDIMSTEKGVQYRGGNLFLFEYPRVLNTPTVLMTSPHMYHDIPHGTQISKDGMFTNYELTSCGIDDSPLTLRHQESHVHDWAISKAQCSVLVYS